MGDDFDPYYRWLAIPPEQQPADHYRLLGLKRYESAPDVIEVAADRQMLHIRNFAAGKQAELSQRLLNEIAAARLCLLNAKQRAAYDKQLRARYAQPAKKPAAKPAPAPAPASAASELEALTQIAPPPSALRRGKVRKSGPAWIPAALVLGIVVAGAGVYFVITQQNAADGSRKAPTRNTAKADANKSSGGLETNENVKLLVPKNTGPGVEHPLPERPAIAPPLPVVGSQPTDASTDQRGDGPTQTGPEPATAEQPAAQPAPVSPTPSESDQATALAEIKDRHRADYSKLRQPEQKLGLARKLFKLAGQAPRGATQRYVLLHEAATLAAAGGDADAAMRVAQEIESEFVISGCRLRAELLTAAAKGAHIPEDHRSIAKHAELAIAAAIAEDQFDTAQQLAKTASAAIARLKEPALAQPIRDLSRQIDQLEAAYRKLKPAFDKLAEKSDDPAASVPVGKYYCFTKADWTRGLPLLAQGEEPTLKTLAEQDLASPTDAPEQLRVGDAWWELADELPKDVQARVRGRAAHWYDLAAPRLSESNRVRINKRLADSAAIDRGGRRKTVYLDDLDERQALTYYGGVGRHGRTGHQGQSAAIFQGVQPAHSLAVHPASDTSSLVVYQIDGKFSRFQAVATLIDFETPPTTPLIFKVLGDGRVLWQSPPIQRRMGQVGESQSCDVAIGGVRELRLVVECPGINTGADAIWIDPRVVH